MENKDVSLGVGTTILALLTTLLILYGQYKVAKGYFFPDTTVNITCKVYDKVNDSCKKYGNAVYTVELTPSTEREFHIYDKVHCYFNIPFAIDKSKEPVNCKIAGNKIIAKISEDKLRYVYMAFNRGDPFEKLKMLNIPSIDLHVEVYSSKYDLFEKFTKTIKVNTKIEREI